MVDEGVGEFIGLFKEREMAGIFEPDEMLFGGVDALGVIPN